MARAYNNLGLLYRSMRRYSAALEFHQKSMEIRRELGDDEGVVRNALNLAWVHFEMESFDRAEELAARAEQSSAQLGLPRLRAKSLGLLGEIHLARERNAEARDTLEAAIELARRIDDREELFMDLRKMADLELRCNEVDRAEARLQEADGLRSQAASPLEEAHWSRCSAEVWRARGDRRRAAMAYENAGNTMARLGHTNRAAGLFLSATQCYRECGVTARARELVLRARQLFERDAGIAPAALLHEEMALGAEKTAGQPALQSARMVDVLCRVAARTASAGNDPAVIDHLLSEMRAAALADTVHLLRRDQPPIACAGAAAPSSATQQPSLLEDPRFVARALQTLLPFGSSDAGAPVDTPFLVVPVEANGRNHGSVLVTWAAGDGGAEDDLVPVLRAIAQHLGVVLERHELPAARAAAVVERTTPKPLAGVHEPPGIEAVVGRSAARQVVVDFIRQVRDLDATVLLTGENGTGKEVVSRAIHHTGARRDREFISINCTAIPEALWERELFGNERGAFTDAREAKPGYFERAHRGTLLLDEIGDMPWEMQTKFLRVLEEKSFTRIGGTEIIQVDVRIIAATNQDLEAAVETGRFRRDLFHRLNVLALRLPPLRDRREDIPELARHFLESHATRMGVRPKRLSGEALRILTRYSWPGNVRELENAMKGSLVLSDRDVLMPEDMPVAVLRGGENREAVGDLDLESVAKWILDHAAYSIRKPLMEGLENALARQMVKKVEEKTVAAKLLGISKPTLYKRIRPEPRR
jgi:DNA-binding NtrC family response regulator/tetratricopeptide (TPR) repeat protein